MAERDLSAVDPELWPLIEAFPPIDVSRETLKGFRVAMAEMSPLPDLASHDDVRVEELRLPGDLRCLLFRPVAGGSAGALLHIHGGGYVMGLPEMDVPRNIALVRATGCTILSVDYRLAPEHPHPAGAEDCHAALVWLAGEAGRLGFPAGRIGVIGESAGGGLAASTALMARDRGSVALACQILVYPMLTPHDRAFDVPEGRTGRFIWTRGSNGYCWSACLPEGADARWIAGLTEDLAGLPPTWLGVGDLDLFVHDDLAYVGRLLGAGVSVEAHVYPGAIHGFDRMAEAAVSLRYEAELVGFIRRHLG